MLDNEHNKRGVDGVGLHDIESSICCRSYKTKFHHHRMTLPSRDLTWIRVRLVRMVHQKEIEEPGNYLFSAIAKVYLK